MGNISTFDDPRKKQMMCENAKFEEKHIFLCCISILVGF